MIYGVDFTVSTLTNHRRCADCDAKLSKWTKGVRCKPCNARYMGRIYGCRGGRPRKIKCARVCVNKMGELST